MKKVLYIDDEADTLKMASVFEVIGEEGIELLPVSRIGDVHIVINENHHEIGLVVLDIIIPPEEFYGLDETNGGTTTGLRLLKDIREVLPKVPIIIVSVRRMNVATDEIDRYEISEFIEKPVETMQLLQVIKQHLLIA